MDNSKLYIDLVEYVRSRSVQMEEDVVLGINSATGALSKSVEVRDISSGPIVGFEISALPYFKFVEEGRQKGKKMPPISSIQDWCEVVGIPVEAAYPIAKKISINGIVAKHMLKNAIEKNEQETIEGVDRIVGEGLITMADNLIKSLFITK